MWRRCQQSCKEATFDASPISVQADAISNGWAPWWLNEDDAPGMKPDRRRMLSRANSQLHTHREAMIRLDDRGRAQAAAQLLASQPPGAGALPPASGPHQNPEVEGADVDKVLAVSENAGDDAGRMTQGGLPGMGGMPGMGVVSLVLPAMGGGMPGHGRTARSAGPAWTGPWAAAAVVPASPTVPAKGRQEAQGIRARSKPICVAAAR